jgi:uncharacterized membrane protein
MTQQVPQEPRADGADPIKANLAAAAHLEQATRQSRTQADRLAGTVTRFAGSGAAIVCHALWFAGWILANLGLLGVRPFDPPPFSLLTLIVSLEVIFLTMVVLLNQNHMTAQTHKRSQLEFQVTLLAEREMTLMLRMLKDLSEHLGVTGATAREMEVLLKDTDVTALSKKVESVLDND